jgi:tRNA 2-selenouridine synthase
VVVDGWKASVREGNIEPVVRELLTTHYDPTYLQSMKRNFQQFEDAKIIAPDDHTMGAMQRLAEELVQETTRATPL